MIIKELYIKDFGKFHNQRIVFEQGFNIVYGENEAGKSTIFQFISAMFYGFYKPDIKARQYRPEYERYKPWNRSNYAGSMLIIDQGKLLRIERNFLKQHESVKVYDQVSGQDQTATYEIHRYHKLPDIAQKHIGLSLTGFLNTMAIPQARIQTEAGLEEEINQSLLQGVDTVEFNHISVNQKIDQRLAQIGTLRRKSSLLATLDAKQQALKRQCQVATVKAEQLQELSLKINGLKQQAGLIEAELDHLDEQKKILKACQDQLVYDKIYELIVEKTNLENRWANSRYDGKYSTEAIDQAYQDYLQREALKQQITQYQGQYQQLVEQQVAQKASQIKRKRQAMLGIGLAIGWLLAIFYEIYWLKLEWQKTLAFAIASGLVGVIWFLFWWPKQRRERAAQRENLLQQQELQAAIKKAQHQIQAIDNQELLLHYQIQSAAEMAALRQESIDYRVDNIRLQHVAARIEEVLAGREFWELKRAVMAQAKIVGAGATAAADPEQLAEGIEQYQQYQKLEKTEAECRFERRAIEKEIDRLIEKKEELLEDYQSPAYLEEQLMEQASKIEEIELEKQVYERVKQILAQVTIEIKQNFSPILNKSATKVVEIITKDRYNDIKVTSDMAIQFLNAGENRMTQVHELSQGTVDLFYIALRMALKKWLTERQLPFIIDESLVQFDDKRLERMLLLLYDSVKQEEENQVILFTCRQRDVQAMAAMVNVVRI